MCRYGINVQGILPGWPNILSKKQRISAFILAMVTFSILKNAQTHTNRPENSFLQVLLISLLIPPCQSSLTKCLFDLNWCPSLTLAILSSAETTLTLSYKHHLFPCSFLLAGPRQQRAIWAVLAHSLTLATLLVICRNYPVKMCLKG